MSDLVPALTVAAAVSSAVLTGVLFAFSTSVMPALARRPGQGRERDPVEAELGGRLEIVVALPVAPPEDDRVVVGDGRDLGGDLVHH